MGTIKWQVSTWRLLCCAASYNQQPEPSCNAPIECQLWALQLVKVHMQARYSKHCKLMPILLAINLISVH